jgi:hypothetical protein
MVVIASFASQDAAAGTEFGLRLTAMFCSFDADPSSSVDAQPPISNPTRFSLPLRVLAGLRDERPVLRL